jgi:hypothetical protein
VSGRLGLGFTIALGAVLSIAVSLLLARAILALSGLAPKNYRGITLEAARARVTPKRLELAPEEAVARLASTYYTAMLPQAREANQAKVRSVQVGISPSRGRPCWSREWIDSEQRRRRRVK